MLFLFVEHAHRDDEREIDVFGAKLVLDAFIEIVLDLFPDGVRVRQIVDEAFDGGIVHELRFADDVRIPLGKVLRLRCDCVVFVFHVDDYFPFTFVLKPFISRTRVACFSLTSTISRLNGAKMLQLM